MLYKLYCVANGGEDFCKLDRTFCAYLLRFWEQVS
jgi:hypothetical protein